MNHCYLCGKEFDDKDTKKHGEHVIQQAIGGSLVVDDILCASCGDKLGKKVDVPFNKIFSGISTRLDIKTDRGNNKSLSVQGRYKGGYDKHNIYIDATDVVWSDFKVSPIKPFHKYTKDNKKVVIYANQQTAKKYRVKVEKEINDKFSKENKPELIICDDLEGFIEFPFLMKNDDYKKGLAKIAIGFASKCGISRKDMPLVLSINNETQESFIADEICIIPFYPLGVIDSFLEDAKDQLKFYPLHNLIVFTTLTNPKLLVCYIELFSTFQIYIILNDNYSGEEIYKYYGQRIMKEENYEFIPDRRYYKERNLFIQGLGITEDRIEKRLDKHNNAKSKEEVEHEIIKEEFVLQKYKFDFEEYISDTISYVSNQIMSSMNDHNKSEDHFNYIMNFYRNHKLFFGLDDNDDDIFYISSYRRYYYEDEQLKDYCTKLLSDFTNLHTSGTLRKYGHKKMYALENYIQKNNTEKK
jgi:hypothetical protein